MNFIFRRPQVWRRRRGYFFGFTSPSTLAPSGVGTANFIGTAVTPGVLSVAGVCTLSGVGRMIRPGAMAAAGAGTAPVVGTGVIGAAISAAGSSAIDFIKPLNIVTSRRIMQDPVDCVLAGQQQTTNPGRIGGRFLRRVFGE